MTAAAWPPLRLSKSAPKSAATAAAAAVSAVDVDDNDVMVLCLMS